MRNIDKIVSAIRKGSFDCERHATCAIDYWRGIKVICSPLFCSYGQIGYTISVYSSDDIYEGEITYDYELNKISIDDDNNFSFESVINDANFEFEKEFTINENKANKKYEREKTYEIIARKKNAEEKTYFKWEFDNEGNMLQFLKGDKLGQTERVQFLGNRICLNEVFGESNYSVIYTQNEVRVYEKGKLITNEKAERYKKKVIGYKYNTKKMKAIIEELKKNGYKKNPKMNFSIQCNTLTYYF